MLAFDFIISEQMMKNIGQHDNVIQLFGFCKLNRQDSIVMKYGEMGHSVYFFLQDMPVHEKMQYEEQARLDKIRFKEEVRARKTTALRKT